MRSCPCRPSASADWDAALNTALLHHASPLLAPPLVPQLYNNLIRNIEGAGFGVWGCYNCMYAYNTLVGVGNRSHLIDIKFGERTCDGEAAGVMLPRRWHCAPIAASQAGGGCLRTAALPGTVRAWSKALCGPHIS